jgi:mRNA interferase RelE/StbE
LKSLYSVNLRERALKQLESIPAKYRKRILDRIHALASDPYSKHVVKLSGRSQTYRLRVGHFRVLFTIEPPGREVSVLSVAQEEMSIAVRGT